jgi:uncharacterized cupin superfamily protein
VDEARVVDTDTGRVVEGEGWFVLNVGEASWQRDPDAGAWCSFEAGDARAEGFGIGVHVLEPGQANGRYHAETVQEGFLVLSGECIALVEGEERAMRQWDYLHCPPGTEHILVGAGDGPCAILMVGVRSPDRKIHYPVSELAARHGASVSAPTNSPREAYADQARTRTREPAPWPAS